MKTLRRSLPVALALLFAAGGTGRADDEDGLLFAPVLEIYNGAVTGPATAATYAAIEAEKPYGVIRALVRVESHTETHIEYEHHTVRVTFIARTPDPINPTQPRFTYSFTEKTDNATVQEFVSHEPFQHGLGALTLDCSQRTTAGERYAGWSVDIGPTRYKATLKAALSPTYKSSIPRSLVVRFDYGSANRRTDCGEGSWVHLQHLNTLYLDTNHAMDFTPRGYTTPTDTIGIELAYAK